MLFALVVVVAKVDTLVDLYRKASTQVGKQKDQLTESASKTNIKAENDAVPFEKDPSLQINPHARIIALLGSFGLSPEPQLRAKIMEDIKVVPKLLTAPLDPELETAIYGWRDLIRENHPETILFMLDLEKLLQGENLMVIRRNFTFLLDKNAEAFISQYSRSRDVGCKAAALFGEPVPEEEKINEFRERENSLQTVALIENAEASVKTFASTCLNVVKSQILTLGASPASPTDGGTSAEPQPAQTPLPATSQEALAPPPTAPIQP